MSAFFLHTIKLHNLYQYDKIVVEKKQQKIKKGDTSMEKKRNKFFSWHTLYVVILVCIINAIIWIALHGFPLIGLPKKEDVKNITIICNDTEERQITSNEDIELLVNAAVQKKI